MKKKFLKNTLWGIVLITGVALFGIMNMIHTDDPDPIGFNVTSVYKV